MVAMAANENIPEQCTMHPFDKFVSIDCDYFVRIGMKDLGKILSPEQEKIVCGIKCAYGIRDGSCAAAILDYMKGTVPFSGIREYHFYRFLYTETDRWSKSTVRRNLRRLEDLGLLKRMYFRDLGEDYSEALITVIKSAKEKPRDLKRIAHNLDRERVFTTEIYLPESILTQTPRPDDPVVITTMKAVKEGEDLGLSKWEHIINKIDLRSLSDREKRRVLADLLKQPFLGIKLGTDYCCTHEQRVEIRDQVAGEARKLSNIAEVYSVGSLPNGDDKESSDVDVLVMRESCPGYENCGARLKKADEVDIFCFSKEEMRKARERRLAILVGASKLYDNSSLVQPVPAISK